MNDKCMRAWREKSKDCVLIVARILLGTLFMWHGVQKLFINSMPLMSKMGVAGVIEFVGGIFIILGLFMNYTPLVTAANMLAAFLIGHSPLGGGENGWSPFANRGELALVYLCVFLILWIVGPGKYALDSLCCKGKKAKK